MRKLRRGPARPVELRPTEAGRTQNAEFRFHPVLSQTGSEPGSTLSDEQRMRLLSSNCARCPSRQHYLVTDHVSRAVGSVCGCVRVGVPG